VNKAFDIVKPSLVLFLQGQLMKSESMIRKEFGNGKLTRLFSWWIAPFWVRKGADSNCSTKIKSPKCKLNPEMYDCKDWDAFEYCLKSIMNDFKYQKTLYTAVHNAAVPSYFVTDQSWAAQGPKGFFKPNPEGRFKWRLYAVKAKSQWWIEAARTHSDIRKYNTGDPIWTQSRPYGHWKLWRETVKDEDYYGARSRIDKPECQGKHPTTARMAKNCLPNLKDAMAANTVLNAESLCRSQSKNECPMAPKVESKKYTADDGSTHRKEVYTFNKFTVNGERLEPDCAAKFDVELTTCNTCCCKAGLSTSNIQAEMILDRDAVCTLWFSTAVDPIFRLYMSAQRALALAWQLGFPCLGAAGVNKQEKQQLVAQVCTVITNPTYSQSKASSVWSNEAIGHKHGKGRLDSNQGWSARHNKAGQWWQMDLGNVQQVAGVVTQGRTSHNQYVKTYKVQTSQNSASWSHVDNGKIFTANVAANDVKEVNKFAHPVSARFVRIVVQSWNRHISMRAAALVTMRPADCGEGFKAEFWKDIHGLRRVDQAIHRVREKPPSISMTVARIDYGSTGAYWYGLNNELQNQFVARFSGNLRVRRSGCYIFWTTSDDGSWLSINGQRVVNNDGLHGMRERHGTKHLNVGTAKVMVWFFENSGNAGLHVHWSGPGFGKRLLSTSPPLKSTEENAAACKPTSQSSTTHGGSSSRAVDGNAATAYSAKSCTHTSRESNPWWRVDLKEKIAVETVTVTNRGDCCGGRLSNFEVRVGDTDKWNANTKCGGSHSVAQGQSLDVNCSGVAGRYAFVVIRSRGSSTVLTLCEVKVKGLKNAGKDCWGGCSAKQGRCSWCGSGYCCRKNWHDKSNGCDGSMGIAGKGHVCVAGASGMVDKKKETESMMSGHWLGDSHGTFLWSSHLQSWLCLGAPQANREHSLCNVSPSRHSMGA